MKTRNLTRRAFVQRSLAFAAGAPVAWHGFWTDSFGAENPAASNPARSPATRADSKVAIVPCHSYGPEVREAMGKCFDLLGGIGPLVKNKTVTVKINLTGTNFSQYLKRPVGETYMTHYATAVALGSLLFAAGARRVRFVESNQSEAELASTLVFADWDVKA